MSDKLEFENNTIKLVLDNKLLERYNEYYFKLHPRASKVPIPKPRHPSINEWMILKRPQMNALKQKWKAFVCWWLTDLGYNDLKLNKVAITQTLYFDTNRRHDSADNFTPKHILDGFTEVGFIVDDDDKHLISLTMQGGGVDRENPRTEFEIEILEY